MGDEAQIFQASDLPEEAFIPTRLVLTDDAFDRVVAQMTDDAEPTAALRDLMLDNER